jgi:hypothetical protein
MRGFIAALLVGVTVVLAVGCGGKSNDAAGTTTVVVTETTAADTTSTDMSTDTTTASDDTSTDTTSSDDTSADTTSTETTATATDTATTAAGLTAGCQKVAHLSVQFGKALSAAGANGSTDLEKTAKAYEAFANEVPEEIRGAFQTMAKAYAQYAVALKGLHLEAGKVPDASTLAKLARASQSLNGQELVKASAQISTWVSDNCSGPR